MADALLERLYGEFLGEKIVSTDFACSGAAGLRTKGDAAYLVERPNLIWPISVPFRSFLFLSGFLGSRPCGLLMELKGPN
jgi:hypothetical protein